VSNLREKVAYLQGLAEGLDLDRESREGKMFFAMMEFFNDVVEEIEDLAGQQDELSDYVEAIDEDLGELESEIYGEDEYPDEDKEEEDEYDEDEEEDGYIEVECPKCHDMVRFDAGILEDEDVIEVTCPNCDEVVYVNDQQALMEKEE